MKALLILSLTLVSFGAMAGGGNVNCSAQAKNDRDRVECTTSLLSNQIKLALNCAAQVRQQQQKTSGAQ